MKPIRLEMQAFESYSKKAVVDFRDFDSSLFLIDGDTGAGKTTIFDAMCYALYGEPSGSIRDAKGLRSDFAKDGEETYVELTFLTEGQEYTIRRSPAYRAFKKTKKGETVPETKEVPATVVLQGGKLASPLTKSTQIDSSKTRIGKIEELIGLSREQFCQTIMIAQGQFTDLIKANTQQRTQIFRQIMGTKTFLDLQEDLKAKAKKADDALKTSNSQIDGIVSSFSTDDPDLKLRVTLTDDHAPHNEIVTLLPTMQQEIKRGEDALSNLKKDTEEARKSADAASKASSEAKERNLDLQEYQSDLKEMENLSPRKVEMEGQKKKNQEYDSALLVRQAHDAELAAEKEDEEAKKKLSEAQADLPLKQAALEEAKGKAKEIPSLQSKRDDLLKRISEIDASLKKFADLPAKKKEADQAKADAELAQSKLSALQSKEKEDEEEEEKLTSALQASTLDKDLTAVAGEISAQEKRISDFLDSEKKSKDVDVTSAKLQEAEKEVGITVNVCEKAAAEEERAERLFEADQAGVLASRLQEGKPCPVCGSLEHPHPHIGAEGVSQAEVDAAKKAHQEALAANQSALTKFSGLKSQLTAEEAALFADFAKLVGQSISSMDEFRLSYPKEKSKEDGALQSLKEKKRKLDDAAKKEKESSERLAELKASLASRKEAIAKAQTSFTEATQKQGIASGAYASLQKELEGQSQEALSAKKETLSKEKQEADDAIASLQKGLSDAEQGEKVASAALENAKERAEKSAAALLTAKARLSSALAEGKFASLEEALEKADRQKEEVESSKREVDAFFNEVAKLEGRIEQAKKKGVDRYSMSDLTALEQKKEETQKAYEDCLGRENKKESDLISQKDILARASDIYSRSEKEQKEAAKLRILSEVANGSLTGTDRMSFEVFYQAQLFDEILAIANKKFQAMSDGRYSMQRHQVGKDEKQASALDIDVLDANTGKLRAISTLSGGESFMAALSLALSFSDVIRNQAGAAELDCMFVDEGFGTLDDESLKQVLQVLRRLSSESNRMVGLISHVDKLSDAISSQIKVTKDENGSHLEILK